MDSGNATPVSLGWLWFDDDPKTSLEQKMGLASARFRQKFGCAPKICYVSAKALGGEGPAMGALQVRSAANVLPGHFLFVVDEGSAVAVSD